MPRLDEHTLASDALSRGLSSFNPAIPRMPPSQGTKRKSSDMENLEASQTASQTCPPIKQEPGSLRHFHYGGNSTTDTHPELYGTPTGYAIGSSSDVTKDQMLRIQEDERTTMLGPSRIPLAAQGRLAVSSRDMSVPLKQEAETPTARAMLQNNGEGIIGLLRPPPLLDTFPPPCRPRTSGLSEGSRRISGNRVEDVAYNSIPDYAPPISTLPSGNPHILKVEWGKGSSFDLSKDPDRHMLHEAEVQLATSLSLSCAKYLCTKRRIFQARFKALKAGREFRKTESQKACKININKASKICGAFEKVGWFDKKHFLHFIDESNNPLKRATNENMDRGSLSSGLAEPDIWDVSSESGFHFTSEEDEESTDEDTADSSVSFDSRHEETEGWREPNLHGDNSLMKQNYGLSLIRGDGSERRVLIDQKVQSHDSLSESEDIEEGLAIGGRRPRRRATYQGTTHLANSDGNFGGETEETPLLETRSRTRKIKLPLNSGSGDEPDRISIIGTENSQLKSALEKVPRRLRNPIPHSLDEADAADIMLVKMKENGRSVRLFSGLYSTRLFESQVILPEQLSQFTPHESWYSRVYPQMEVLISKCASGSKSKRPGKRKQAKSRPQRHYRVVIHALWQISPVLETKCVAVVARSHTPCLNRMISVTMVRSVTLH